MRLLEDHPGGAGYLLKQRVSNLGVLTDALMRLSDGECVIDPTIVVSARQARPPGKGTRRAHRTRARSHRSDGRGPLEHSNLRPALPQPEDREAHVKHIFRKLDIDESPDDPPRARGSRLPGLLRPRKPASTHQHARLPKCSEMSLETRQSQNPWCTAAPCSVRCGPLTSILRPPRANTSRHESAKVEDPETSFTIAMSWSLPSA